MMKLTLALVLLSAASLFGQTTTPEKATLSDTQAGITLQATPVMSKSGKWNTQLWLTSPVATAFKVCFRYFDGGTTRSLIKIGTGDPGMPVIITLEVPIETLKKGSLYVYEMLPMSVVELDAH